MVMCQTNEYRSFDMWLENSVSDYFGVADAIVQKGWWQIINKY
jgi:hypothetical protein